MTGTLASWLMRSIKALASAGNDDVHVLRHGYQPAHGGAIRCGDDLHRCVGRSSRQPSTLPLSGRLGDGRVGLPGTRSRPADIARSCPDLRHRLAASTVTLGRDS